MKHSDFKTKLKVRSWVRLHPRRSPANRGADALTLSRRVLKIILRGYEGPVAAKLWNGEIVRGSERAPCAIVFNHPGAIRDLILGHSIVKLAENHLAGLVDTYGSFETIFDLVDFLDGADIAFADRLRLLRMAFFLPRCFTGEEYGVMRAGIGSRLNCRESISHHYDLSNDFYRLWLDPEMVYSCAYFRDDGQSLADAQRDKLDYLLRKLRIRPGQTLLDIGCGWGALVCMAAREYGAFAHGITLSREQYEYAVSRTRAEGLEDRVKIELRDYRDLPENTRYDRIVSVGMFEHIGIKNFPVYFGAIKRVLKPGGLFLNHGITNDSGWKPDQFRKFVNRYVFPDGELTKISVVLGAMEQAGFEILDVENLRRHYAMTLRRWVSKLEAHSQEAIRLVGEPAYRLWRLYMAGSAYYFDTGTVMVYQALAGHNGQSDAAPLRRDDLYQK